MIVFVSNSKPCKINTDDKMLVEMNIDKKIANVDCIALDGGYNNAIKVITENTNLNIYNFVSPVRKKNNIELDNIESEYNLIFGGFRSKIEKNFADIGETFKRFNNEKPIRTSDINIFNIQFKISCLLLNIKNFVKLGNIELQDFHKYWLDNSFDFPTSSIQDKLNGCIDMVHTVKEKINYSHTISILQDQFLGLNIENNEILNENSTNDMDINDDTNYEVEYILDHKGIMVEESYYFVKWKNYPLTENSWVH